MLVIQITLFPCLIQNIKTNVLGATFSNHFWCAPTHKRNKPYFAVLDVLCIDSCRLNLQLISLSSLIAPDATKLYNIAFVSKLASDSRNINHICNRIDFLSNFRNKLNRIFWSAWIAIYSFNKNDYVRIFFLNSPTGLFFLFYALWPL